ncbi:MAG: amino acid permease, partial [Chloroflexota bacterium]
TGIIALGALSIVLLVLFSGSVDKLIPLYAVGVFLSFTLSQAGMVVHWQRTGGPGWRRSAAVNGVGAVATGAVTLVIAATKFVHGAWLIVLLIPAVIALLRGVHRHYERLSGARVPETPVTVEAVRIRAIVPIADLGIESQQALAYARRAAGDDARVTAVHISDDAATAQDFQERWRSFDPGVSLVIIESPFRSLVGPLLAYLDALKESHPDDTLTVVLPEFVVSHWWENLLHNQTAFRLKVALLFHPGIVVTSVPYHLGKAEARGVT